jgi:hypothetical protein
MLRSCIWAHASTLLLLRSRTPALRSTYRFLHNVRASGARYLLIGSYISAPNLTDTGTSNRQIVAGDYFDLDVTRFPFSLRPAPMQVIWTAVDYGSYQIKRLRTWCVVAAATCCAMPDAACLHRATHRLQLADVGGGGRITQEAHAAV